MSGPLKHRTQRDTPAPEQPVAAEKLKALYSELLEIELASARLQLEQARIQNAAQAFNAKVAALGIDTKEWRVDYKSGKMTRQVPVKAEPEEVVS